MEISILKLRVCGRSWAFCVRVSVVQKSPILTSAHVILTTSIPWYPPRAKDSEWSKASSLLFFCWLLTLCYAVAATYWVRQFRNLTIPNRRICTDFNRINKHSKVYGDATEKSVRFSIFRDHLKRIHENSSKLSSHKLNWDWPSLADLLQRNSGRYTWRRDFEETWDPACQQHSCTQMWKWCPKL